jgi:serine/threonine-protein kinase HipA
MNSYTSSKHIVILGERLERNRLLQNIPQMELAQKAGISMMPCRIHQEGGRSHFMTKRFDQFLDDAGRMDKLHVQTLAALQHYDFNDPNGYSYEQALMTIRELGLGNDSLEEQFRRAVFNVLARNQDDHVKNIAFLMDRNGEWSLSPAYDVTYSFNASGAWTSRHQMSLNGKRDDYSLEDLIALGESAGLKPVYSKKVIESVAAAIVQWEDISNSCCVDKKNGKANCSHPSNWYCYEWEVEVTC